MMIIDFYLFHICILGSIIFLMVFFFNGPVNTHILQSVGVYAYDYVYRVIVLAPQGTQSYDSGEWLLIFSTCTFFFPSNTSVSFCCVMNFKTNFEFLTENAAFLFLSLVPVCRVCSSPSYLCKHSRIFAKTQIRVGEAVNNDDSECAVNDGETW